MLQKRKKRGSRKVMSKYDYIKRQLAKTNKKNDENYIITR
ncbi:AbaSI family restriction endonuclease, partial [Priestia megaterium]